MDNELKNTLIKAYNSFLSADRMFNLTYKLVNDKKLFLKIIEKIHESLSYYLDFILFYESRIRIKDFNDKLDFFIKKDLVKYNISDKDINSLEEIVEVHKDHKNSAIEFVKNEKIIIFLDNQKTVVVGSDSILKYLMLIKSINKNINERISKEKI